MADRLGAAFYARAAPPRAAPDDPADSLASEKPPSGGDEPAAAPPNYARIFFGALHSTLLWRWWLAGLLKLIGGAAPHAPPPRADARAR